MTIYLYKVGTTTPTLIIENVQSYTADCITTLDESGETVIYSPLSDECEVSSKADCSEHLRLDWRNSQEPSTEQRVSGLEEQLVQADETAIALYEVQEAQEAINAQQDEALMEIYEIIGR